MVPNNTVVNGVLFEHDAETEYFGLDTATMKTANERKLVKAWWDSHTIYLFTLGCCIWRISSLLLNGVLLSILSGFGITAGAHRLWAHRSYKAKWPLRLILIILNTLAVQASVFIWARDHRTHHKHSETDADPHNATRGFFFSHMGWLMVRKHPEVIRKGKELDLSDLYADPFVRFQNKHYIVLALLLNFVIITLIPGTTGMNHGLPRSRRPSPHDGPESDLSCEQNISVSVLTLGEGYHNYHHTFPWDYKAAELGCSNLTTRFINFFSKIGWAYDLKTVSDEIIRKRVKRTGDGSHGIWGWGDKDQPKEEIENATELLFDVRRPRCDRGTRTRRGPRRTTVRTGIRPLKLCHCHKKNAGRSEGHGCTPKAVCTPAKEQRMTQTACEKPSVV